MLDLESEGPGSIPTRGDYFITGFFLGGLRGFKMGLRGINRA